MTGSATVWIKYLSCYWYKLVIAAEYFNSIKWWILYTYYHRSDIVIISVIKVFEAHEFKTPNWFTGYVSWVLMTLTRLKTKIGWKECLMSRLFVFAVNFGFSSFFCLIIGKYCDYFLYIYTYKILNIRDKLFLISNAS